jgi:hypothetical protein
VDRVANFTPAQREELFRETGTQRNISPAVVEKDFWVCWVLKQIFSDPDLQKHLVFKGGTTLSKVFGLIERFSEDIDLILDWQLLGFGPGQEDPFQDQPSRTQQNRFNEAFNARAAEYIADKLCPHLAGLVATCPEVGVSVDPGDPQVLNVGYPEAFSQDYLRPEVRLEIGPLASWVPSEHYTIQPYAAESFPHLFNEPNCEVVATTAERTFWEKATILHQQAHRTSTMPARLSRHYYDLYQLANSEIRNSALGDLALLADVVAFKMRFYPSAWARYEDAHPGKLRLMPPEERLKELEADYREMRVMIFGHVPPFDQVIATLQQLEEDINNLERVEWQNAEPT